MKTAAQIAQEKKLLKPRNPLVAQVLFKKAGAHQASRKTERQQGKKALRQAFNEGCSGRPQKSSAWMISAGDLFFERFRNRSFDRRGLVLEDQESGQAGSPRQGAVYASRMARESVLEGLRVVAGAVWVRNLSQDVLSAQYPQEPAP